MNKLFKLAVITILLFYASCSMNNGRSIHTCPNLLIPIVSEAGNGLINLNRDTLLPFQDKLIYVIDHAEQVYVLIGKDSLSVHQVGKLTPLFSSNCEIGIVIRKVPSGIEILRDASNFKPIFTYKSESIKGSYELNYSSLAGVEEKYMINDCISLEVSEIGWRYIFIDNHETLASYKWGENKIGASSAGQLNMERFNRIYIRQILVSFNLDSLSLLPVFCGSVF